MRIFLTVLAALLVAGGSGYYLLAAMKPAPQAAGEAAEPREERPRIHVFVPARPLPAGTILLPEHLAKIALEEATLSAEMIRADDDGRTLLVGSVARQALAQGVPIARSAVVQPGERGFLAAVLPRGKRAISIPVSEVAGLSGLVMPGDRVDIILTYSVDGSVIDAERDIRASETVLTNLRVLALDQRLGEADPARANDPQSRTVARTATLEVTPQEAEILTLSTQLGELSLVLNSVEDGGERVAATEGDVVPAALARPAAAAGRPLRAPTLDSQVTTLLHRDPGAEADRLPPAERLNRVQIVRGIESRALEIGGGSQPVAAASDPLPLAASTAAPAGAVPPN
jgi:pilus assembly protein CpaB